jgi:glutaminyl-tRNA synthetase
MTDAPTTAPTPADRSEPARPGNFIRNLIEADRTAGKNEGRVVTRFPPEPNGYLHIGHAKSICLNFGLARDYGGRCHLRFDDTNPEKEEVEYIESIQDDVRWLGFDWGAHLYYASDYFEQLYEWAEHLIRTGKAYVCDLSADELREYRGTLTQPGTNSPYRVRSVAENLDLFRRMRAGEFPDGARTLRAKIDMASPNVNLRDPILYRIRRVTHHRTGDAWLMYPSYDFAHGQSDAIEGITHSICTLEFEDHRPLYDWCLDNLPVPHRPQQIEFARLNLNYTVMSKRKLLRLVKDGHVSGWDDPRMPTIAGIRRRGYTAAAIRDFCDRIGLSKADSVVDVGMLEAAIRDDLETTTKRATCVHDPLKVVIENWPEGQVEEVDVPWYPAEPDRMGRRSVPFTRTLFIEREDFQEVPQKKWFRLAPGAEVRLRWAYVVRCTEVVKDESGRVVELRCTYDPETGGDRKPEGRKVKGTIHWLSAENARPAEVRLYDRLFDVPNPNQVDPGQEFTVHLNPNSLVRLVGALVEAPLLASEPGERVQFERKGYYYVDPVDSRPGAPVFHRIVALRDTWAKLAGKQDE